MTSFFCRTFCTLPWLTSGRPPETLSDVIAAAPTLNAARLTQHGDLGVGTRQRDRHAREAVVARNCAAQIRKHVDLSRGAFRLNRGVCDRTLEARRTRWCPRLLRLLPSCPFVQGTHLRPWFVEDSDQYLIAPRSSGKFKWPWSAEGINAEETFRKTHPSVLEHLNHFRDAAIKRTDQGAFWWELRSCDYWDAFDGPKIVLARHQQAAALQHGYGPTLHGEHRLLHTNQRRLPSRHPVVVGDVVLHQQDLSTAATARRPLAMSPVYPIDGAHPHSRRSGRGA